MRIVSILLAMLGLMSCSATNNVADQLARN